jgi:hypothetical protein
MRRLAACVLLAGVACGPALASSGDASDVSDQAALKSMREEITKLIGDPRCVNLVHCRVLALGSRPCGGASEYVAYSSTTGNREVLEAKAYEYTFLQEEVNRKTAAIGACSVLAEPKVACTRGRCALEP